MKVAYHGGAHEVNVGDKFTWEQGDSWEVVELTQNSTYGPSGIGGTPVFKCRALNGVPSWYEKYRNEDGTIDFCGDSIASALASRGPLTVSERT